MRAEITGISKQQVLFRHVALVIAVVHIIIIIPHFSLQYD